MPLELPKIRVVRLFWVTRHKFTTKGQTTGGGGNSTSPLVACPVTPPLKLRKAIKTTPPQRLSGSAATFPLRARMHARKTAIHLTQGSAIGQDRCGMENDLSAAAEFAKRFATEAACRDYLIQLRWPDGFRCPHCGGRESWRLKNARFECRACGRQTSARLRLGAPTIFTAASSSPSPSPSPSAPLPPCARSPCAA